MRRSVYLTIDWKGHGQIPKLWTITDMFVLSMHPNHANADLSCRLTLQWNFWVKHWLTLLCCDELNVVGYVYSVETLQRERERERERDTCFYPVVSRTCFSVWFKVCIEIACTHLYRNSVQYAVYCTVSKPSVLNNEYQSLKQSSDNFNAKYVYKM